MRSFNFFKMPKSRLCKILLLIITNSVLILLFMSTGCTGGKEKEENKPEPTLEPVVTKSVVFDKESMGRDPSNVTINGYDSINGNAYVISSEMTIDIASYKQEGDEKDFNVYYLSYNSDQYIKGTITYSLGDTVGEEVFYLEPGEEVIFTSLINDYLKGTKGGKVTKITMIAYKDKVCNFELLSLETDVREVPESEFAYIQNEHYKFGVDLSMGGGVCYLEDLSDGDDTLTNLLNRADEGRLIQQSYYGDMDAPYKPVKYGENLWSYNPVQGGDQHRNRSKIVDYVIGEDYIYIKCIPMDWAQNGIPAQCYMENKYTFKDTYIEIDNRFVDYSGYMVVRSCHQELPAFYVISYLSDFYFYSGKEPWTQDELTVKKDLPFWGGNSNAYFSFSHKNKERWCAWADENGYGIGLYTPLTEILLAGRHQYNGSKDPKNGATNYVAPLITAKMGCFTPFEYKYYVTTGTVSEIRASFTEVYNSIQE